MPPGNTRTRPSAKVIERMTAEACLAIAQQIQQDHLQTGDTAGSQAAAQIAASIRRDLLHDLK